MLFVAVGAAAVAVVLAHPSGWWVVTGAVVAALALRAFIRTVVRLAADSGA
jgi:hypothetical protein